MNLSQLGHSIAVVEATWDLCDTGLSPFCVNNRQHQFSGNLEELDETVRSMMVKSTNLVANRRARAYAHICKVCGKEGLGSAINHIEVNHLEGIVLPCNHCASNFKTRVGLRTHATKAHA